GRAAGHAAALVPQYEVPRRPAGAASHRAGILQRLEEGVRHERVVGGGVGIGAGVPRLGGHVGDLRRDLDLGMPQTAPPIQTQDARTPRLPSIRGTEDHTPRTAAMPRKKRAGGARRQASYPSKIGASAQRAARARWRSVRTVQVNSGSAWPRRVIHAPTSAASLISTA